jgi:XTP/dITP diphosphohydrolase
LVLASGNAGKLKELQAMLGDSVSVLPQSEFVAEEAVEDGLSFVENAIIKARHACKASGLPSLADDSGIAADALSGAPGIYSARYAGVGGDAANNAKLLQALEGLSVKASGTAASSTNHGVIMVSVTTRCSGCPKPTVPAPNSARPRRTA